MIRSHSGSSLSGSMRPHIWRTSAQYVSGPTSFPPGSPSEASAASRMSAVCEGLRTLEAELQRELQHSQAGFDQLLSKVKELHRTALDDSEEAGVEVTPASVGPSPGIGFRTPEVPQTPKVSEDSEKARSEAVKSADNVTHQSTQNSEDTRTRPVGKAASVTRARSIRKSVLPTKRRAPSDAGRLKLMACWTTLQTLHEETQSSSNNKDKRRSKPASKQLRLSRMLLGQDTSEQEGILNRRRSFKTVSQGFKKSWRTTTMATEGFLENDHESEIQRWLCFRVWRPHSTAQLLWNFMGLVLLFYDIVVIPIEMAWDLEKEGARYDMFIAALVYWTIDFLMNFNTGYFVAGKLVLTRWKIARHYLCTWLLPDLALLALDYLLLFTSSIHGLSSLRSSRFMRSARLLRIIKQGKTTQLIDSMAVASGCTAEVVIILPLLKTIIFILTGVHLMSCGWFWMGRSSMERGDPNWLVSSGSQLQSLGHQYVHAFRWVLCQFTPAPNQVNPQNLEESVYTIFTILISIVTMGASLARISSSVQQLNAMKFAKDRRLREIRLYLLDQNVSAELSHRVLTFADYTLQHSDTKDGLHMDYSLISVKLRQELIMHRTGGNLCLHPLMRLVLQAFPDVFMRICEYVSERVYEEGELVFRAGTGAQCMYIITNGEFLVQMLQRSGETQEARATARQWFTDIALFSNVVHQETLQSKKFGKLATLEGFKFAQLLHGSPACAEVVIDFANRYLQSLRSESNLTYDFLRERAQEACENTQAFRWYSGRLRLSSTDFLQDEKDDEEELGQQEVPFVLRLVLEGSMPIEEALSRLDDVFPELEPSENHVYTRFGGDAERFRAGASVLSVLCLLTREYDLFTAPQDADKRLSEDLWEQLQLFVQWTDLTTEAIHGVLVFLVIRGAGKIKSLTDQLPVDFTESPECAVQYVMEELSGLLPSCKTLSAESRELLVFLLEVQREFHIAQFMQGENSPFSVASLQEYMQDRPAHYYRAYLLSFIGIMSGLAGCEHWKGDVGSSFMTQRNASTIVEVVRALQWLSNANPREVYWNYIEARARRLGVPDPVVSGDPGYRFLARFLCLLRAQDLEGRKLIEAALKSLDETDYRILVGHFLADGFADHPAYVLAFLPACLANAQANNGVGLPRCLAKLAEIFGILDARRCFKLAGGGNVKVDLSDLSRFIATVKSASVFNQCVEHMKIIGSGDSLSLSMSTKNWSRVHDDDASEFSAYQSLRQLINQQEAMKEILKQLDSKIQPANSQALPSNRLGRAPAGSQPLSSNGGGSERRSSSSSAKQ